MTREDFQLELDSMLDRVGVMHKKYPDMDRDVSVLQIFLIADMPGILSRIGGNDSNLLNDILNVKRGLKDSFEGEVSNSEIKFEIDKLFEMLENMEDLVVKGGK